MGTFAAGQPHSILSHELGRHQRAKPASEPRVLVKSALGGGQTWPNTPECPYMKLNFYSFFNTRKFVTNRDPASPHHMLSPRMGAAIMTPNQRM